MAEYNTYNGKNYFIRKEGLTQAMGDKTFNISPTTFRHQVTLSDIAGSPSAGTLTVWVRPRGASSFEAVQQGSVGFTAPVTITFSGFIDAIKLVPANFNGSTYAVVLAGGE